LRHVSKLTEKSDFFKQSVRADFFDPLLLHGALGAIAAP